MVAVDIAVGATTVTRIIIGRIVTCPYAKIAVFRNFDLAELAWIAFQRVIEVKGVFPIQKARSLFMRLLASL